MYICEECESVFEAPNRKKYREEHGEITIFETCPKCGSEEYSEVDYCDECYIAVKPMQARMCRKCKLRLREKFSRFLGALSRVEIFELDDILDGESIENFL
ncbi:MAG: hypothetical protein KBS74_04045 [Clostridiales bacterium]|nr:hypothetical protein [Candidatus Cacconaster stercorequi]